MFFKNTRSFVQSAVINDFSSFPVNYYVMFKFILLFLFMLFYFLSKYKTAYAAVFVFHLWIKFIFSLFLLFIPFFDIPPIFYRCSLLWNGIHLYRRGNGFYFISKNGLEAKWYMFFMVSM